MKVSPIKSPLDGEQVVAVTPNMDRSTEPDWRRRVNHFTGRALTHTALRSEQAGRSGRVASLGQMLSPGIVNGLIVDQLIGDAGQQLLNISAGHGIDANGEIVRINSALRIELNLIPVNLPVALSEGDSDTSELGGELVRTTSPDLQTAIATIAGLPRAAILVLQPVQVEMNLAAGDDPCELDAEAYAYENWQLVDGARLVLYSWPEEVMSLPGSPTDSDWRNQLASRIFGYEKNLAASEVPPWTRLGVPLAMIGFDAGWQALFADRNAVVRAGGKRQRSTSILTEIGNRYLWQARFDQFNEHLVDSINALPPTADIVSGAADQFRYLPPVGVLPKNFVDFTTLKQNFFPLSYHVEALAVPYEQLDVIVQDSAGLAAFDFNRADRVQTLIPVPQIYFEPDILKNETLDPEFNFSIQNFMTGRNDWLGRRLEIRRKYSALNWAISGISADFNKTDKNAVDSSELASPFEINLIDHGDTSRYLKGSIAPPSDWNSTTFNDNGWLSGTTGIGYKLAGVETELDDMSGNYVSIFLRQHFNLSAIEPSKNYRLEVLSNGGFLAYLNGKKILTNNLKLDTFDALADDQRQTEVRLYELGDLNGFVAAGDNLMAVQAHASALKSEGFIFSARLVEVNYVNDVETSDYGLKTRKNDKGKPLVIDGAPDYQVEEIDALRQYFETKTYKATDGSSKPIWAQNEIDKFNLIESEGLEGFIDLLQSSVNKANDKVDFGFVRSQTDIYRLRQFMLGNEEATKLATSPVLAGIAKGQTAVATKEEITRIAAILSSQQQKVGAKTSNAGLDNTSLSDTSSDNAALLTNQPLNMAGARAKPASPLFSSGFEGFNLLNLDSSSEPKINISQVKKESLFGGGSLFGNKTPDIKDIEEQASLVGSYSFFRNTTVGERLNRAATESAIDSGRANRIENIANIKSSGLSMEGIYVPGFKAGDDDIELPFSVIANTTFYGQISGGQHDPNEKADEASWFNSSILNLESSTALLRLVEGRVKTYRLMIDRCKKSLALMYSTRTKLDKRLKIIEDELAEARHDVAVSRALKAEEEERIEGINLRRKTILEEQVPFLIFRRPRLTDTLINTPMHTLNPDLSQAPLPFCDIEEDEVPEEISAMIEVIKEAPIKWFGLSDRVLKLINRPTDLHQLLKGAKARANSNGLRHRLLTQSYSGLNRLALGINKTLLASQHLVMQHRRQTAAIDLASFVRYGWQQSRKQAVEVISLGDIIDGKHGRMGASKLAAIELEQIAKVSVCLYFKLAETLPSIRLDWAERLSQYDAPFNLRDLYSLPRWDEIDFIERSEMQRLTDWLYSRIESQFSDAGNIISELIRVCILLASHSPVNQIISGLIPEPVQLKVGSKVNIIANISNIRIGMNIAMVSGKNTLARGRVSDIVGGQVQAHILSTATTHVLLEKNARVQIGEPRVTGGTAYRQNRVLFRR